MALLLSALAAASNEGDFWIFGAGLIAGALIVVALRRDFRSHWDGRDRRRRAQ
jgi:hypothetical protein